MVTHFIVHRSKQLFFKLFEHKANAGQTLIAAYTNNPGNDSRIQLTWLAVQFDKQVLLSAAR